MRKKLLFLLLLTSAAAMAQKVFLSSPNNRLEVMIENNGGLATYAVYYDGVEVLQPSRLGFEANFGDFTQGLTFKEKPQQDTLDLMPSKLAHSTIYWNRKVFKHASASLGDHTYNIPFKNAKGQEMTVVFRLTNNDIAFRYEKSKVWRYSSRGQFVPLPGGHMHIPLSADRSDDRVGAYQTQLRGGLRG